MKKLLMLLLVLCLVSCGVESQFDGQEKGIESNKSLDISGVNVDEMDVDDIIFLLGKPDQYLWGNQVYDEENLPQSYLMEYDGHVYFYIADKKIVEMRIERGPSTYDDLYIGQSMDLALSYLTEPDEVLDQYHLYFKEGVLYKNISGRGDGHGSYYDDKESKVRIWFYNDLVNAIYFTSEFYYEREADYKVMWAGETDDYYLGYRGNKNEEKPDDNLKGLWLYKDFVYELDEFDPGKKRSVFNFVDLEVLDNGIISNSRLYWETGKIRSVSNPISRYFDYEYYERDGIEYLLLHDMYDYEDGGMYIFEKKVLEN